MHTPPGALHARKWIFATGALTGLGIVVASLVILSPLTAARHDLRSVTSDGIPVQGQLGALRTTVLNFQVFLERHIDNTAPGKTPTPTELASGALLAQTQMDQETTLANGLRGIARSSDARDLDAAMKTLGAALEKMTPIAVGTIVPAATRARLVETERAALERLSISISPATSPRPTPPPPTITWVAVALRC